jgi:hypothetical protein
MSNGRDGSPSRPFNVAARPRHGEQAVVAPYRRIATTRAPKLLACDGSLASVNVVRFSVVTHLTL